MIKTPSEVYKFASEWLLTIMSILLSRCMVYGKPPSTLKPRIHERFFRPQESVVRRLMRRFTYTHIVFITQLRKAEPGSIDWRLPCVRVCWCCSDGCNNSQCFVKHCCGIFLSLNSVLLTLKRQGCFCHCSMKLAMALRDHSTLAVGATATDILPVQSQARHWHPETETGITRPHFGSLWGASKRQKVRRLSDSWDRIWTLEAEKISRVYGASCT